MSPGLTLSGSGPVRSEQDLGHALVAGCPPWPLAEVGGDDLEAGAGPGRAGVGVEQADPAGHLHGRPAGAGNGQVGAEALAVDTNPLRHSAREALALSAWKQGKAADSLKLFEQITADEGAPRNSRERATMMSELIRGSGAAS